MGGFWDWVKNPDYRRATNEFMQRREAASVPADISDRQLRRMVRRLFRERNKNFNFERLQKVGPRLIPFLLEALDDPGVAIRFIHPEHPLLPQSPFERICELLEPFGAAEAVGPLTRFLDHGDADVRRIAGFQLARIGTAACAAPVIRALRDRDTEVRAHALLGLAYAVSAARSAPAFREAIYAEVAACLDDDETAEHAPDALLRIDRVRGADLLLSSRYFTASYPHIHDVLEALNRDDVRVPHAILLPLLAELKSLHNGYPNSIAYGESLIAYALNPDQHAEDTIVSELASTEVRVRQDAAKAYGILHGVPEAISVVLDANRNCGIDRLSKPQADCYAVFSYDAEVLNGGHAQYFANSSGDHWRYAVEGLGAIAAYQVRGILQKGIELFGPEGPSTDTWTRAEQLAAFDESQDEALKQLDTIERQDCLDVLLWKYIVRQILTCSGSIPSPPARTPRTASPAPIRSP